MPNRRDQIKPRIFSGIPLYIRRAACKNIHRTPYLKPEIRQEFTVIDQQFNTKSNINTSKKRLSDVVYYKTSLNGMFLNACTY